jgi:hypothetical protein
MYACLIYLWLVCSFLYIYALFQCHQQPPSTHMCGYYVALHMTIMMAMLENKKPGWYANMIFCFYWNILLICTCFDNDLFYLAKHRNGQYTDDQAKIDLLGDCRVFGSVRDESRRRVPPCVRGLSNLCSYSCHVCFLQTVILSSNCHVYS